jgi:hypothetical protein
MPTMLGAENQNDTRRPGHDVEHEPDVPEHLLELGRASRTSMLKPMCRLVQEHRW